MKNNSTVAALLSVPALAAVSCVVVLTLSGCPASGVVCQPNTVACENGCVDTVSDRRHCGACGQSCGSGQECVNSACTCLSGSASCAGACVQLAFDTQNCGQCGKACAAGQSCDQGVCKANCEQAGTVRCGFLSCVNTETDLANCGGCGLQCQSGESCRSGKCAVDVVVACFNTKQLAGFSKDSYRKTPLQVVGNGPQSLASFGDSVLVADTLDKKLYQAAARVSGVASGGVRDTALLGQRLSSNVTGAVSNHVLVSGERVLVTNSGESTLQVFGRADGGMGLVTIGEVSFGVNANPWVAAAQGDDVWVPLYGGFGSDTADAGQRIAHVSIVGPTLPTVVESISLSTIDLKPFPGAVAIPRPSGICVHQAKVYVALNNLGADYSPAGPGQLAQIDIATKKVTGIDLGKDCLNAGWVASAGNNLVVSCTGNYGPPPSGAGVVLVEPSGNVLSRWIPQCRADAGACALPSPGRLRVSGNTVFAGDNGTGNVVVLEIANNGLVERRGPSAADGPLAVCPADPDKMFSSVADVEVLP